MHTYSAADIVRDYGNSWMRHPHTGAVCTLTTSVDDKCLLKTGTKEDVVNTNQIDWKHVGIPRLGYRNLDKRGKNLVYFERKVGRNTSKGLNHTTVTTHLVTQVLLSMRELGIDSDDYANLSGGRINESKAKAMYDPVFADSLADALSVLSNNGFSTGVALSHDFAVVLGPRKHNAFQLLWKQVVVAVSKDGQRWYVMAPEYKDIINRQFGHTFTYE